MINDSSTSRSSLLRYHRVVALALLARIRADCTSGRQDDAHSVVVGQHGAAVAGGDVAAWLLESNGVGQVRSCRSIPPSVRASFSTDFHFPSALRHLGPGPAGIIRATPSLPAKVPCL